MTVSVSWFLNSTNGRIDVNYVLALNFQFICHNVLLPL